MKEDNMNITKKYRSYTYLLLLTVFVAITLSACQGMSVHQAYDGAARPEAEVATIIIPEAFNILFIDRKKFGPALYSGNTNITVLPGKHQLIIKYKDFWDLGDGSERIESDPISITMNVAAGNKYQVQFPKLANIEDARAYAKNPSIEVVDQSTHEKVAAAIEYKLYTSGFFSSLFGPSNQDNDDQSNKEQKSGQTSTPSTAPTKTPEFAPPATVGITAPATQSSSSETPATGSPNTGSEENHAIEKNARALDMLKYWWRTADQTQKEAFQQWIKSQ
jgi:uncharacterized protein YccT (UPF0319 family)